MPSNEVSDREFIIRNILKGDFSMNENQNQDYSVFGGWMLVWYWGLIVGGILLLLSMVLPALFSIAASIMIGIVYLLGILINIASVCVSAVFEIKAALQMKARNPQFFDTFVLGMLISLGGGIISSLLRISSVFGIGSLISSAVSSIVATAVSLSLCTMYFSKSVRVKVYFSGRPLQSSKYWNWIRMLPDFIISENMPDPGNFQQTGSQQNQQQNTQYSQPSPDQQQNTPEDQ